MEANNVLTVGLLVVMVGILMLIVPTIVYLVASLIVTAFGKDRGGTDYPEDFCLYNPPEWVKKVARGYVLIINLPIIVLGTVLMISGLVLAIVKLF